MTSPRIISSLRRRGFSLLELLAVVAIIGVLSVMATTGVRLFTENGQKVRCTNQLRQIYQAVALYRADNNDSYPVANPWNADTGDAGWLAWYTGDAKFKKESPLASYVGGLDALRALSVCPANTVKAVGPPPSKTLNTFGYPYTVNYNIMLDNLTGGKVPKRGSMISRPSQTVLMADAVPDAGWGLGFSDTQSSNFQRIGKRHGGKSNFLWCDGHVTYQEARELENTNLRP